MCTTTILGTDTKDILRAESFKKILDTSNGGRCFVFNKGGLPIYIKNLELANTLSQSTDPNEIKIPLSHVPIKDMDSNTIYIGVDCLHSVLLVKKYPYPIADHPILKSSPDIIFFVHDADYITTLKRLCLTFSSFKDDSERLLIMKFSTYYLVNSQRLILPNDNKDFIANMGSYTGKKVGSKNEFTMVTNERRPFMSFSTSDITCRINRNQFVENIKKVIKLKIMQDYDDFYGTIDNPPRLILETFIMLIKYANRWINKFESQTNLMHIEHRKISKEEYESQVKSKKFYVSELGDQYYEKVVRFNDLVKTGFQYKTDVYEDEKRDDENESYDEVQWFRDKPFLTASDLIFQDDNKPLFVNGILKLSEVAEYVTASANSISADSHFKALDLIMYIKEQFLVSLFSREAYWLGDIKEPIGEIDFDLREGVTIPYFQKKDKKNNKKGKKKKKNGNYNENSDESSSELDWNDVETEVDTEDYNNDFVALYGVDEGASVGEEEDEINSAVEISGILILLILVITYLIIYFVWIGIKRNANDISSSSSSRSSSTNTISNKRKGNIAEDECTKKKGHGDSPTPRLPDSPTLSNNIITNYFQQQKTNTSSSSTKNTLKN